MDCKTAFFLSCHLWPFLSTFCQCQTDYDVKKKNIVKEKLAFTALSARCHFLAFTDGQIVNDQSEHALYCCYVI